MFTYTEYFMPSKHNIDIDEIVRDELMTQYRLELEHGTDNTDFLDSLLQVIEFYCTGKEYREFFMSIHGGSENDKTEL